MSKTNIHEEYAEKRADEIFAKFYGITCSPLDAKECSLYFVDEMIKECSPSALDRWKAIKTLIEKK